MDYEPKPFTNAAVPRGIEVLLKKASVDPEFRELLLKHRGAAAGAIELELTPAEIAILKAIPAEQLEQLISQTVVPVEQRRVFLGRAAAAMLAVIGATLALQMCRPAASRGIQSDRPRPKPAGSNSRPTELSRGISPDPP